jgi:indolepyruvate decarboxylase
VRWPDSQLNIFREMTCAQAVLDDPRTTPRLISDALYQCVSQSLPVYFEIPSDLSMRACAQAAPRAPRHSNPDAVAECATEIAATVRSAKRPVLMIGDEVRRFGLEAETADLARRTHIPVVTSFMGRGVAASHSINSIGTYLGLAGDPEITKLVEESDALILLGVIMCDTNLGLSARRLDLRNVVHAFGGEVRIGHHTYPDIALKDLVRALFAHAPAAANATKSAVPRISSGEARVRFIADDGNLMPSDVAGAVNELFSNHGVLPVVCDVGDSLFVSLEINHADLVAQAYYASMGFAVPAAFGIQAATRSRPLVLVGDGAFQMTGWELGNCQRYGFDPIVLVLNNRSWEMLRTFAPKFHFNDLSDWHFAKLAPALGGSGVRARSRRELARALEAAHGNRGRFQLIEVALDRGDTSNTLTRFVRALGAK